jgi:hypothetical protein
VLQSEFSIVQLFDSLSVACELLDGVLFADVTGFFLTDGINKCPQIKHLSLNPVSDVNKWILQFFGKALKFQLKVAFIVGTN